MGFISTGVALALSAAAIGTAASSIIGGSKKSSTPTVLQNTDTADSLETSAEDTASEEALKKRRARTKTVLTGPRGLLTEPETQTKTLLGA